MIGSYSAQGDLPPRVIAVLAGAARGETALETAQRLHVSAATVAMQRRVGVQRLGARNLYEAIAVGTRAGILD